MLFNESYFLSENGIHKLNNLFWHPDLDVIKASNEKLNQINCIVSVTYNADRSVTVDFSNLDLSFLDNL